MSISRFDGGTIVFSCDECGEDLFTDHEVFDAALEDMKDQGWKNMRHKDGSFSHICPACHDFDEEDDFDKVEENE